MKKITLIITEEAEQRAEEIFNSTFDTDNFDKGDPLPCSKEWNEYLNAWENRQSETINNNTSNN